MNELCNMYYVVCLNNRYMLVEYVHFTLIQRRKVRMYLCEHAIIGMRNQVLCIGDKFRAFLSLKEIDHLPNM